MSLRYLEHCNSRSSLQENILRTAAVLRTSVELLHDLLKIKDVTNRNSKRLFREIETACEIKETYCLSTANSLEAEQSQRWVKLAKYSHKKF